MTRLLTSLLILLAGVNAATGSDCLIRDNVKPRVAVKSNMLYDTALLLPDLGAEVALSQRWSFGMAAQYAWWGKGRSTRCWHIGAGQMTMRYWWGGRNCRRALTGHHLGAYASMIKYDLELGGRGYQSVGMTYGIGLAYGYSWRLTDRLNLDLGLRAGYDKGPAHRYRPECGALMVTGTAKRHYLGLTGAEVTLVWFPGRGRHNNPDYSTNP